MVIEIILGVICILFIGVSGLLLYRHFIQRSIMEKSKQMFAAGGISEVEKVTLGGVEQFILIEGKDLSKPLVLMLHGGPGSPFPFGVSSRGKFPELTDEFIVVYWDQRGAGKSYDNKIDPQSINLVQFVADANQLIDYVRERFNQEKIYLTGQSWGTAIGLNLIHQYPEKFAGYVANAQIVSIPKSQMAGYEWLREKAAIDIKLRAKLDKLGMPPYLEKKREGQFGDLLKKHGAYIYKDESGSGVSELSLIKGALTSPDYTLKDLYAGLASGFLFSWNEHFFKQFVEMDFSDIKETRVPMTIIQGQEDYVCPNSLTKQFFERLTSTERHQYIELENTAHYPDLTEVVQLLRKELKSLSQR